MDKDTINLQFTDFDMSIIFRIFSINMYSMCKIAIL